MHIKSLISVRKNYRSNRAFKFESLYRSPTVLCCLLQSQHSFRYERKIENRRRSSLRTPSQCAAVLSKPHVVV
jgi:hypothetical protein